MTRRTLTEKTVVIESENSENEGNEFSLLQEKIQKSNEVEKNQKRKMAKMVEESSSDEDEEQPKKKTKELPPVIRKSRDTRGRGRGKK